MSPQTSRSTQRHQTPPVRAAAEPGDGNADASRRSLAELIDPDAWAARATDQTTLGSSYQLTSRRMFSEEGARRIREAGWRPPAQVIETPEALEALPVDSVVFVDDGRVWQRHPGPGQCWFEPGWTGGYTSTEAMQRAGDAGAAVRVLYLPTENGDPA